MQNLRFSVAALAALFSFSLYLVGVNEAEETYALMGLSLLSMLSLLFLVANDDWF